MENLQHLALVSKVRRTRARVLAAWGRAGIRAFAACGARRPPLARPGPLSPRCTRSAGQVCTELENHVGVGDKTLAEFIINLAGQCSLVSGKERRGQDAGERAREQAAGVYA